MKIALLMSLLFALPAIAQEEALIHCYESNAFHGRQIVIYKDLRLLDTRGMRESTVVLTAGVRRTTESLTIGNEASSSLREEKVLKVTDTSGDIELLITVGDEEQHQALMLKGYEELNLDDVVFKLNEYNCTLSNEAI